MCDNFTKEDSSENIFSPEWNRNNNLKYKIMTQEQKELLLKELSTRLPYHVKVHYKSFLVEIIGLDVISETVDILEWSKHRFNAVPIEEIKPYLRSMSSMTAKEREELSYYRNPIQRTDFYYSHYIDCRFMIKEGLALKAPEGMYN